MSATKRTFLKATLAVATALSCSTAQGEVKLTSATGTGFSESLQNEAHAALDRGYRWLERQQADAGSWSNPEFPALTALPVWALARGGRTNSPAMHRGISYLLSCAHTNGAIYREPSAERKGGGLSNYNTALSMVALHEANQPRLADTVLRARAFLAGSQHLGDDEYCGGMGYDPDTGRAYADLSNSYVGYEAMALTRQLQDLRNSTGDTDLDWDAAIAFTSSIQNEDGGFIYAPGESKAGSITNAQGEVRFRSYGSMTYAGLLSLIYAEVDRDDPRIKSAFDWAVHHWSLEENPGMGAQGLFYFYNVLAKGLAVYGADVLKTETGKEIHWREELIRKLVGLQRIDPKTGDGYWVNEDGRWWEQDPVLVTSYALLALEMALPGGR